MDNAYMVSFLNMNLKMGSYKICNHCNKPIVRGKRCIITKKGKLIDTFKEYHKGCAKLEIKQLAKQKYVN